MSFWRCGLCRYVFLVLPLLLMLGWAPIVYGAQVNDISEGLVAFARYNKFTAYDRYFRKYSKRFFGAAFDWHYFKAQAVAESNLRPDVRSSAGAVGVMQIVPRTFEEVRRKDPSITGSVDQPRWNIAAGIAYDRQNFVAWIADRPLSEKLKFMFGSYNAGRSNILRAQQIALVDGLNGILWESIAYGLPKVTGRYSRETLGYVERIFGIRRVLR